jgi:MFS family permease
MSEARVPLQRRPAFLAFWIGEGISHLGSHITDLALPLTAILLLGATADQMGVLAAAGYLPFLLVGLLAGVWVDRFRRRPILIVSDLLSAAAVASIPAAWVLGVLRIEHLYVVAFVLGLVMVVWTVAYQSFVPTLVSREDLVEANAKLEAANSVGTVAGPSLGGLLVQLVGAPFALIADALSYLVSVAFLGTIRVTEPPPIPDSERRGTVEQIREGLRLVARTPLLASLAVGGATHNFFARMIDALYVLYAIEELRLEPVAIGLTLAAGGPGSLLGALLASRVPARLGIGPTIALAQALTGGAFLTVALAGGPAPVAIGLLIAAEFLLGLVRTIYNVNQVSLRMAITSDRMHGRVNATIRFLAWAVTPVGALVGGVLAASVLGLRATMVLAATGVLAATLAFVLGPMRTVRDLPAQPWGVGPAAG